MAYSNPLKKELESLKKPGASFRGNNLLVSSKPKDSVMRG